MIKPKPKPKHVVLSSQLFAEPNRVADRLSGSRVFDDDAIIDAAFHHFRETGFPNMGVAVHTAMQQINDLAEMNYKLLLNTSAGYHIADRWHTHRHDAAVHGRGGSLKDAFADDNFLRRAIFKQRTVFGPEVPEGYFPALLFTRSKQGCANFRPGWACAMYRRFCNHAGSKVLDTCFGFGGRLIGAIASGVVGKYVGFDPSTPSYVANVAMADALGFSAFAELYRNAIEDVDVRKFANQFDFAMTSPPYWKKEEYSDDPEQSFRRYPELKDWQRGFLVPCLRFTYGALKKNAHALWVIGDVRIGKTSATLVQSTIDVAKRIGFTLVSREIYSMPRRMGLKKPDVPTTTEQVLIFKKG